MKSKTRKALQKFKPQNFVKSSPEEILKFLHDYQTMLYHKDEKTKAISLRVPSNVLRMFKTKAASKNQKYQSVIVALMRDWLKNS